MKTLREVKIGETVKVVKLHGGRPPGPRHGGGGPPGGGGAVSARRRLWAIPGGALSAATS